MLDVRHISKSFAVKRRGWRQKHARLWAVRDVSFTLQQGETLALVGESGCGKSTLGRLVLRLHQPDQGTVHYRGTDLTALSPRQMRPWRRHLQVVFQDPYSSLNPRRTIRQTLLEALQASAQSWSPTTATPRIAALLERVGLRAEQMHRYPHEFSGGQRQRIGIARALAVAPELIVLDEPVSALDVSVQAQVINLLRDLQRELSLSFLLIAHDLHLVRFVADRVAVMYLGAFVETGPAATVFQSPKHPYTRALLAATPVLGQGQNRRLLLVGDPPSPLTPPTGCAFHTRCPAAIEGHCDRTAPVLRQVAATHWVACHLEDGKNYVPRKNPSAPSANP